MSKEIKLQCPKCKDWDEYPKTTSGLYSCTNCGLPFVHGNSAGPYMPGNAGMAPDEANEWHRAQILEALQLIKAWTDPADQRIKLDIKDTRERLEAFNALIVNTTTFLWEKSMIEFIGDIQQRWQEFETATPACAPPDWRASFMAWLADEMTVKKQQLYAGYVQTRANCQILETFLNIK